jgi:hypothetical protein
MPLRLSKVSALAILLAVSYSPLQASTIKELKLQDGREADNTIGMPIFNTSAVGTLRIGTIEAAYDRKEKICRKTGSFMTKGPQYDLDPKVDLAAYLTEVLRSEAPAMGFKLTEGADFGWDVQGSLKDIYLESRQVYMGATQFWGYMDVELRIQKAGGAPATERLRIHNYYAAYSAGMGRRDEATESLTHLLVEGSQEILSRLNRGHFKAPPHADVEKKVAGLSASKPGRNDLHLVGLSGTPSAVAVVQRLLPAAAEENDRAALIDALARLGSPESVGLLAGRYDAEDDDAKWETLKAMDYVGGDQAKGLVTRAAADKDNESCRRLAERILGKATKK